MPAPDAAFTRQIAALLGEYADRYSVSVLDMTRPDGSITMQLLAVQGPMARTVDDVRIGLTVLSGAHIRDPQSAPVPLEAPPAGTRKVAVCAEPPGGATDPRVAELTRAAGRALEAAGCVVEEVTPPAYDEVVNCWRTLVVSDITLGLPLLEPIVSPEAASFLKMASEIEPPPTFDAIGTAWMNRHALMRMWDHFYAQWDVVVTPTWAQLPFEHGADAVDVEGALAALIDGARPVMAANVLAFPSAAVPGAGQRPSVVRAAVPRGRRDDRSCRPGTDHADRPHVLRRRAEGEERA